MSIWDRAAERYQNNQDSEWSKITAAQEEILRGQELLNVYGNEIEGYFAKWRELTGIEGEVVIDTDPIYKKHGASVLRFGDDLWALEEYDQSDTYVYTTQILASHDITFPAHILERYAGRPEITNYAKHPMGVARRIEEKQLILQIVTVLYSDLKSRGIDPTSR